MLRRRKITDRFKWRKSSFGHESQLSTDFAILPWQLQTVFGTASLAPHKSDSIDY